jgi:hypothetical protein
MPARQIATFAERSEATAWLSTFLAEGDLLWAKGSRPMLLERLLEDLRVAGIAATTRRTAA